MNRQLRTGTSAACAGLLATLAAAASPALAQPDPVVLSVGHVDALEMRYQDGTLSLGVKDDTGAEPVSRDPADVVLHALPGSRVGVPEHPDFGFLGAPGDPVWILPQIQNPDLLWPGWNTEQIPLGTFQDDQLSLTLTEVDGPGEVFVYIEDFLGLPTHQFSSEPGFPDRTVVRAGTHTHANWAFTAAGTYTLTVEADATLLDGTTVSAGPVDYTFVVGERAGDPESSQRIVAAVDELDGALMMSVDPEDRVVTMSPAELAAAGDRLVSIGALRPVTVTDTRPAAPGWDASGSLGEFTTTDGDAFGPGFAGWTPTVESAAGGQGVVAGPAVPPGFGEACQPNGETCPSGAGLAGSALIAGAPGGNGLGTAVLGADLRLELPTQTPPGQYRALLTLTVI